MLGRVRQTWRGPKDEISFGAISTAVGDLSTVPTLLRVMNEVKEAFSTARYLLIFRSQNRAAWTEYRE